MGKFATFVIGGALGAAAALLLSPRSGEENRAMVNRAINEKYNVDVQATVQEKTGAFVDAAAATSTKVINTVVDNGSDAYKAVTSRAQQAIPAAPAAIGEGSDELREKIDAARERIAQQVAKNAEAVHDAAIDKIPAAADAVSDATAAVKDAATTAVNTAEKAAQEAAAKLGGQK